MKRILSTALLLQTELCPQTYVLNLVKLATKSEHQVCPPLGSHGKPVGGDSHDISSAGHRRVHSIGCSVSDRLMTVQRTEKHLAHHIKTVRYSIHLGMATRQLKPQAEALEGTVWKEGACRHGGLRK